MDQACCDAEVPTPSVDQVFLSKNMFFSESLCTEVSGGGVDLVCCGSGRFGGSVHEVNGTDLMVKVFPSAFTSI